MIDKLTESLRFQGQAVQLRAERQALLASNVANADTPGYKAVDVDFASALKRATDGATQGSKPAAFAANEVRARNPMQAAQDGNGVDMDGERARFAENAIRYEAAMKALNHQIKSILSVIQG